MGGTLPTGHHREGRIPNFNESASGRKSELVDFSTLKLISDDAVSRFRRLWGRVGEWPIPF